MMDGNMMEQERPDPMAKQDGEPDVINRQEPDTTDERQALIAKWSEKITKAKQHHAPAFKRMEQCMRWADGHQWSEDESDDERYSANLIQRHVHQRTSALYARNPTVVARRRERLLYKVWDGNPESVLMAQQTLQQQMMNSAAGIVNPMAMVAVMQAQALLADYQQGQQQEATLDRIAKTLEILSNYFQHEQFPRFKQQMKQAVRRALTNSAAFAKAGFQRMGGPPADFEVRLADAQNRLARLEQLIADRVDGELSPQDAEAEELKLMIADLEQAGEVPLREGPIWSFPRTQNLIIDPCCRELVDFVGAMWMAEEYLLTAEQVEQFYRKSVGGEYMRYGAGGERGEGPGRSAFDPKVAAAERDGLVCVWEVYDKQSGIVFVIADGYKEFLREPKRPPVTLEQFFPYFTLSFNQLESDKDLYPQSDVWLLRHPQREYNRSKEAYRQHRYASRPLYAAPPGWAEDKEMNTLAGHAAHSVITLKSLGPGQKVSDFIQPVQKHAIDPNFYETGSIFDDITRVVGTQEANLGGTSNATATESSIAESSRMSSLGSQTDDLDDMLTAMKRAEGQIMLQELSKETVMEIVGPGAVWPELSALEIAKEISLEIEAGSSGRPNQAADAQMFAQMVPILIQIPGVVPRKLAAVGLKIMDSKYRVEDFMDDALPSIQAMNQAAGAAAQPGTGDPATDPGMQGGQGVNNGPKPDQGGDIPGATAPAPPQIGFA